MNEDSKSNGLMKWGFLTFLVICLSGVVIISILRDRIVNNYQNQVSVNGQGRVSYQPDIANISLGVQVDKIENSEEALKILNDKVGKIISSVTLIGIDSKNIKNLTYSLSPVYDYVDNINTLTGYNANQQIIIRVQGVDNNFEILNKVILEAAKSGANQVLGVSFESSEIENLKQEARLLAINDARDKAASLSQSLGLPLGEIVGWFENVINPSVYNEYSSYNNGYGGFPTVTNGKHEVVVEMSVNYKIKNKDFFKN